MGSLIGSEGRAAPSYGRSPVVGAAGLTYHHRSGRVGVEGVDLRVTAGEIVALLGPNGSGKTTLLRLLSGELPPTSGRLEVLSGEAPVRDTSRRRRIGFAGDSAVHFDELTGRENAAFFARASGGAPSLLLEALGLGADAEARVADYSFGMRRKLLLGEALAHDPSLVLLDEPFIGLDPGAVAGLCAILRERAARGVAVVFATNALAPVPGLASRTVFLRRGRVVGDSPPDELLASLRGRTTIEIHLEDTPARPLALPEGVALLDREGAPAPQALEDDRPPPILVETERGGEVLPELCRAFLDAGAGIRSIQLRSADLAEIFRRLTGEEPEG